MQAYWIETVVTLIGVCLLAVALLWGARRLGAGRPAGPIELVGHLPLDARRAVYLVKVGAQVFVVAAGEGGFTKLGELPASAVPPRTAAPTFGDVLARVMAGRATNGAHGVDTNDADANGAPSEAADGDGRAAAAAAAADGVGAGGPGVGA